MFFLLTKVIIKRGQCLDIPCNISHHVFRNAFIDVHNAKRLILFCMVRVPNILDVDIYGTKRGTDFPQYTRAIFINEEYSMALWLGIQPVKLVNP